MSITGVFDEHFITSDLEILYLYKNSPQINAQTGFQGYLRGDFDHYGETFYHDFFPYHTLEDPSFSKVLQEVFETLRKGLLASFMTMAAFCKDEAREGRVFNGDTDGYGIRIDHNDYTFMLRLVPRKGDYHVYCFCYRTVWLEQHIKKAKRGIRFIDPSYNELFRLKDGGKIQIKRPAISASIPGAIDNRVCRYIDDYHMQVGENIYHICEFAEAMQASGNLVEPLKEKKEAEN